MRLKSAPTTSFGEETGEKKHIRQCGDYGVRETRLEFGLLLGFNLYCVDFARNRPTTGCPQLLLYGFSLKLFLCGWSALANARARRRASTHLWELEPFSALAKLALFVPGEDVAGERLLRKLQAGKGNRRVAVLKAILGAIAERVQQRASVEPGFSVGDPFHSFGVAEDLVQPFGSLLLQEVERLVWPSPRRDEMAAWDPADSAGGAARARVVILGLAASPSGAARCARAPRPRPSRPHGPPS